MFTVGSHPFLGTNPPEMGTLLNLLNMFLSFTVYLDFLEEAPIPIAYIALYVFVKLNAVWFLKALCFGCAIHS